jgi:hypothetical protein
MRKLVRLAAYLLTAYLARVLATRRPRHRVAAKESDTNESRRPFRLRDGGRSICPDSGNPLLDVVDDGAPAIRLYERIGWRLEDRRQADWVTPQGERLPVRIYLAPEGE